MKAYPIHGFGFLYPETTYSLGKSVFSVKVTTGPHIGTVQIDTLKNEIAFGTLFPLYDSFPNQRKVYIDNQLFAFAHSLKQIP